MNPSCTRIGTKLSASVVAMCRPVKASASSATFRCSPMVTNLGQAGRWYLTEVSRPHAMFRVSSTSATRPVAVLHGLGTGTDTPVRWVLGLTVACVALIAALTGWRLAYGWPSLAAARLAGALALVVALIAGGAWLTAGPLRPGWSLRAGTPTHLVSGSSKAGGTR